MTLIKIKMKYGSNTLKRIWKGLALLKNSGSLYLVILQQRRLDVGTVFAILARLARLIALEKIFVEMVPVTLKKIVLIALKTVKTLLPFLVSLLLNKFETLRTPYI